VLLGSVSGGIPGCAVVTAGPGVMDALTGVANAWRAQTPMLLIGGQGPLCQHLMGSLQAMDNVDIMRSVTKFATAILETKRIPDVIGMAFRHAYAGRPAPVYVETPMDLLFAEVDENEVVDPGIGYGNAPAQSRPFADETVDNVEAGAKFNLADQRVRLAFAAFHTRYDQFQNAGFVGLQFLVNNAANVTGFEAEGTLAPARGLTINTALTYLRAKYDPYLGGACYYGRTPDSLPDSTGAFTACNLSGSTLPFAPDWRTTVGLQYEHGTRVGALYGRADWQWSSDYYTNTNLI
jgi:hypothetical protein